MCPSHCIVEIHLVAHPVGQRDFVKKFWAAFRLAIVVFACFDQKYLVGLVFSARFARQQQGIVATRPLSSDLIKHVFRVKTVSRKALFGICKCL
jgi:hypothetical protein